MADILIIEDEPVLARNIADSLRFGGHSATVAPTGEAGLQEAAKESPDLILLDYRLPGIDGIDVLRELRARETSAAVVMMTAHGNVDTAVEAMKLGAEDFLSKPIDLKELDLVVSQALGRRRLSANLAYFRRREQAEGVYDDIIGTSAPMKAVKQFIDRLVTSPALAAQSPPSVLIEGETGTGKDLIARAIHFAGARKDGPFVHVNCTALPDHLVESELFGHVKGAFTDARSDRRGLLETADGGTVFLDEIGHMKPGLQAKLLAALEQRVIRPVGGTKERSIDVHFVAATNRNLEEAIESDEFRDDLYHRIRVLNIVMPPLRERGSDIDALAEHFLNIFSARFCVPISGFDEAAIDAMRRYDWPGNVRELQHTVESAVLHADGPLIRTEHLHIQSASQQSRMNVKVAGKDTVINLDFDGQCPTLEAVERHIIEAALEHSRHNLTRAARILGISRDAIRYRLDRAKRKSQDSDA